MSRHSCCPFIVMSRLLISFSLSFRWFGLSIQFSFVFPLSVVGYLSSDDRLSRVIELESRRSKGEDEFEEDFVTLSPYLSVRLKIYTRRKRKAVQKKKKIDYFRKRGCISRRRCLEVLQTRYA